MPAPAPVFRDRPDTFFGVCEAIGQDFGFNADYLRVALGVLILVNPLAMLAAYAGLGVAVAVSRLVWPTAPAAPQPVPAPAQPEAVNDAADGVLAAAA